MMLHVTEIAEEQFEPADFSPREASVKSSVE